jgi:hypothetical protein
LNDGDHEIKHDNHIEDLVEPPNDPDDTHNGQNWFCRYALIAIKVNVYPIVQLLFIVPVTVFRRLNITQ